MDALIRYCLFLLPEGLLLAAVLWLAVSLGWMQPFTAILILGLLLLIAVLIYPAAKRFLQPGPPTGVKALIGRETALVRATAPVGQVRLDGELWRARSMQNESLPAGTRVRVVDAIGLELIVQPLSLHGGA
jgi:membrane protein implicated in regulation of membrane protease activity